MCTAILLRNGVVLIHQEDDHVQPIKADVLIRGNRIETISDSIEVEVDFEVIDCTGKILSPGFVDAHHHLWQTQLKGRHGDDTLLDYVIRGTLAATYLLEPRLEKPVRATNNVSDLDTEVDSTRQASNFEAKDVFWGQFGGCLEALDAGTTTVVDHAHMNVTADHSKLGLSATISSGIRSVFCYSPNLSVKSWNPFEMQFDVLGGHVMETFAELAKKSPFANGRVELGFGFDSWFLPNEMIVGLLAKVKAAGVRLITSHLSPYGAAKSPSLLEKAESLGVLTESILWAHASRASDCDIRLLQKSGSSFVSTAGTELQMGHGLPLAYQERAEGIRKHTGVGIDCHSNVSCSIPGEIRLGLQATRGSRNGLFHLEGLEPSTTRPSIEDAFNLGTLYGARAIGMSDRIGSIEVGKLADLVIFDTTSPSMVCGAQHNPLAAILLHSSPRDIEYVIVDGAFRKKGGKLVASKLDELAKSTTGVEYLEWKDISQELVRSRISIQEKAAAVDYRAIKDIVCGMLSINKEKLVDHLPDGSTSAKL